jgi:hypothetical protein
MVRVSPLATASCVVREPTTSAASDSTMTPAR